jgi:DNA polymerase III gamma/tau subunit
LEANILRPRKLSDIVGQSTIVKGLNNFFNTNSVPNVLYFIGASGGGKNSLANIVALNLNCEHLTKNEKGEIEACLECPSCKDIINEQWQRDVETHNGADMKADDISDLEASLSYSTKVDKNRIIIINEAQRVTSLHKLLEIIEAPRKNVYFIITSTDTEKFKNRVSIENKDKEKSAFRSRGSYFSVKPIAASLIKELLFNKLMLIDTEGKVPDTFIQEGLQVISEKVNGNLRQAINDFMTCLSSEAYTTKDVISLMDYEDDAQYLSMLYKLCTKDNSLLSELLAVEDTAGFFAYTWSILSKIGMYAITGTPLENELFTRTAKSVLDTGNLEQVLRLYEETLTKGGGVFNAKLFMNCIYFYYKSSIKKIPVGVSPKIKQPRV